MAVFIKTVELIIFIVCIVFLYIKPDKKWNKLIRLTSVCILLIINLFQLHIKMKIAELYSVPIIMIIICCISIILIAFELHTDS